LTPAIAIHDACHNECIPCWVGAAPQTAVASRIGLALAAKANCTYPADLCLSHELFESDLADAPIAVRDSADGVLRVPLWSEPGIGVEPDLELLEKHCLQKARV
jgi:hypothetical protein